MQLFPDYNIVPAAAAAFILQQREREIAMDSSADDGSVSR
jgi:hypothetical protein